MKNLTPACCRLAQRLSDGSTCRNGNPVYSEWKRAARCDWRPAMYRMRPASNACHVAPVGYTWFSTDGAWMGQLDVLGQTWSVRQTPLVVAECDSNPLDHFVLRTLKDACA